MCRPSCCDNSRGQPAGIAAVAIIVGAALIVAKIGSIMARIIHIALDVIRIAALTAAAVLAFTMLAWLTVVITRWWLRHHGAQRQASSQVTGVAWGHIDPADDQAACLACGGSGTVLRAIGGSGYQPRACPVCEPARQSR
jgi:hypothetical protein